MSKILFMFRLEYRMPEKCSHDEIEFLGDEKGETGVNKYFRCLKCGNVLILSEEKILYEVPKAPHKPTN
ncbi:MAG: hypothetical protein QXX79_00450 [Candidatus Bathyarchaeia archaeon]